MNTTAYKTLLIILLTAGSWDKVNSQQYPDSLLKYLEISAKNNPTVQQKLTEYQAALQRVPQVGSLPDPELSAGVFLKPMELVSGNQVADLRIMQMFPWFGVIRNAKDEMSLMANAKFEIFRDSKLQLFFDVQRSWYDLFKVRKDISISEKNIEILNVIERLATVRFKTSSFSSQVPYTAGSGTSSGSSLSNSAGSTQGMQSMGVNPGNSGTSSSVQISSSMQSGSMGSIVNPGLADLYRIQIETGELQNNIDLLKNQEQSVIALFNSYLNRSPVSPVFTGDILASDSLGFPLIAVSDSIHAKNPMLSMLDYEKQSYSAREKMVKRMSYPMLGLGLNYSIIGKSKTAMGTAEMNGKDMIMPMVSVTFPIYRKKYAAMQKEADLLGLAASLNYQATANSLQTEYYQAVQLYQDSQRRVILYENQYDLASKSLDLMLKSFSTSSSGLTDVLRVRQQTLDYELKQTEAVADFNTAVAWLKRLMAFSQLQ